MLEVPTVRVACLYPSEIVLGTCVLIQKQSRSLAMILCAFHSCSSSPSARRYSATTWDQRPGCRSGWTLVRRDPGITHAQTLTMACKELDQGMIAQRLTAVLATSTHQKEVGTVRVGWTFVHDVIIHCGQRLRLMKIHIPFCPRFRTYPFGMIGAIANDHASSSILEILQMKREHFPWPETSVQHQQQHGFVPFEPK